MSQQEIEKVVMGMTKADLENLDYLKNVWQHKEPAHSVSRSIQLAKELVADLEKGNRLLMEDREGNLLEIKLES